MVAAERVKKGGRHAEVDGGVETSKQYLALDGRSIGIGAGIDEKLEQRLRRSGALRFAIEGAGSCRYKLRQSHCRGVARRVEAVECALPTLPVLLVAVVVAIAVAGSAIGRVGVEVLERVRGRGSGFCWLQTMS